MSLPRKSLGRDEFLEMVRGAFPLPPQELSPASVLRQLEGWDSLTSVMLVAEIYAGCGVQVSGEEMHGCTTVADLLVVIESKLGAGCR
ncbi:MAG: acyl carrier protein [Terrimicrobiaceae bacterium]